MWSFLSSSLGCTPETPLPPVPVGSLFVSEPSLAPLDPVVPLVREVLLETVDDSEVAVTFSDGTDERRFVAGPARTHRLPLVRMRPDREVTVSLTVRAAERLTRRELSFHTEPLPDAFPEVMVRVSDPERMAPGDTLFGSNSPGLADYHVVLDSAGEVVWFWVQTNRVLELQRVEGDVLLGVEDRGGGPFERSWTGQELRRFSPADQADDDDVPVDVRLFHHDVQRLEDGRLIALTNDPETPPSFPTSYTDPEARGTDEVVRVDRAVVLGDDGAIEEQLPLSDLLPFDRIGYDSLIVGSGERNWTHTNAVVDVPEHGALLISVRNQDTVVAVDRETFRTRWILANPANWPPAWEALRLQPVGAPFGWNYHQHAPEWNGDRVTMFDNGNYRASPWTGEPKDTPEDAHTRVVEFVVDEEAGTVALAWEFELPERLFCAFLGDVDRQPGGTVLADFAYVSRVDGVDLSELGLGNYLTRLVEFDADTREVVWDVELHRAPDDRSGNGWTSFRAQRLPEGWGLPGGGATP